MNRKRSQSILGCIGTSFLFACSPQEQVLTGDEFQSILVKTVRGDRIEEMKLVEIRESTYVVDVEFADGRSIFVVPRRDLDFSADVRSDKVPVRLTVTNLVLRENRYPGATRKPFVDRR